ncbi:MAG: winged helix-turn-helix domain-containing protein [Candidatus Eremiobacteraeota bacterium]|nr:winged helix-turn-helix domain-containing protein [Candidatus Eremiobacteraeota bacterium]
MSLYEFGPFQLDATRLLLLDRGAPLPIGPKVVETLLALIEHPGEIFPKGELLARIWPDGYVDEANLAQNIYVLRKLLRRRWNVEAIETIPRRGYRFTAPVARREELSRSEPRRVPAVRPFVVRRGLVLAAALALAMVGGSALTSGSPSRPIAGSSIAAQDTRLYEIGRYYWNLRTRDGIAKSVAYFSRVVTNDPRDSRGYAGLASANAIMADYGYGPSQRIEIARARGYARKSLALDPNNGEAYAVLGLISTRTMKVAAPQIARALSDLRRAIALDPANGTAHQWYGMALLEQGRVADAYGELTIAAQLDPLSVATTAWLGTTAYLERHYRDAIAYANETLDLSPQRSDAYETLGLAYEALGDDARAEATFRRLQHLCTRCAGEAAALLAPLYARSNRMVDARAELRLARAEAQLVAPEDLVVAFEAVGDHGTAMTWLRRWRGDSTYAAEIANDPRFAGLRRSTKSGA